MRINKYISGTGFCSRRQAERYLAAGRVTINGEIAMLASQVASGDQILIDGSEIEMKSKLVYIAFNKPVGITCTSLSSVKGNIIDFIGHSERIFPIGRLDKDSEGLILLTNDGEIVNKILRSENNHEKEYIVTVDKEITDDFLQGMGSGVEMLGTKTKPCMVTKVSVNEFRILLIQGLNRQIRRMCKAFGYRVQRLERVRIMNISINGIDQGYWRDLTDEELQDLKGQLT
jgi:23S rRNA pseudouridine2604 synthase